MAGHIGIPGLSGGYVGVDVFFVISGYLIIGQITQDLGAKRFDLFEFAMRRAFRIVPSFLVVMLTCLVFASTIFVQPEQKEFAESFFLSGIMLANHHYLAHQGYFDTAAFTSAETPSYPPILHQGVLVGDSHAVVLASPLRERARQDGAELFTIARAGCPPVMNAAVWNENGSISDYCEPFF